MISVKFCPPVPDWSYNITLTNLSNSNEFESEILYSCKADQIFSGKKTFSVFVGLFTSGASGLFTGTDTIGISIKIGGIQCVLMRTIIDIQVSFTLTNSIPENGPNRDH